MVRPHRARNTQESNPNVAVVAAILGIGFVLFVFIYDDLKRDPFVQGTTGLIVALVIAVVLFSAVPGSKAIVRLPIGLAGAAAFNFLILPKIQPFIFPFYSFTGRIAYVSKSQSENGFAPVDGAEVEIVGTGLKSKSDATGNFAFSNIPGQATVRELIVSRGSYIYRIEVKNYPDGIYRIPRAPDTMKSAVYSIDPGEWNENKENKCHYADKNKYTSVKQFLLIKPVHRSQGFSDLIIRVWSQQETEIISARKLEPKEGDKVRDADDYSKAQKWSIPIDSDDITIHIAVCIGTRKKEIILSSSSVQGSYWFEKVE